MFHHDVSHADCNTNFPGKINLVRHIEELHCALSRPGLAVVYFDRYNGLIHHEITFDMNVLAVNQHLERTRSFWLATGGGARPSLDPERGWRFLCPEVLFVDASQLTDNPVAVDHPRIDFYFNNVKLCEVRGEDDTDFDITRNMREQIERIYADDRDPRDRVRAC